MAYRRLDRPRDEFRRREGPRGVVDEHNVGLGGRKSLEPGQHALLARCAANGRRPERSRGRRGKMRERLVIKRAVVGVDHDLHRRKRPGCGQGLERVGDKRAPGAIEILLRPRRAEPEAPARGDDQKRYPCCRQWSAPTIGRDAFPA